MKCEEPVSDVRRAAMHAKHPETPAEVGQVADRLLDVREAAAMLALKPATLYAWAYERRIAVVKPSGPRGPLRFRLSTLLGLLKQWERPALRSLPAPGGDRVASRGRK